MRLPRAFLLVLVCASFAFAKAKVHTAVIGKPRLVTWAATQDPSRTLSLQIRPLIVDGRRKEWVTGETHDVTDHSFVVLQVQHLNDALPREKLPHYIWQTGAWLLVERNTGRVSPIHLTGYDPSLSGISWFRDYAAYCALTTTGKSLYAEVTELGARRPIAHKRIAAWPLPPAPPPPPPPPPIVPPRIGPVPRVPSLMERMNTGAPHPQLCTTIEWDRDPLRIVITPRSDMPPVTFDLNPPAAGAEPDMDLAQ